MQRYGISTNYPNKFVDFVTNLLLFRLNVNSLIMEQTVKQRLIGYLEYKNISNRKFEMQCGLPVGYVRAIRKSIQPDKIIVLLSLFPN